MPAETTWLRPDLTILTYDVHAARIPDVIDQSERLIHEFDGLNPPETIALQTGLALATLLRPLVEDPDLSMSELLDETGGPDGNPHRKIDLLAGALIHKLLPTLADRHNQPVIGRIEEEHEWDPFGSQKNESDTPLLLGLFDPVDGTGYLQNIEISQRFISTGILLTDAQGNPRIGIVASLVDSRVILVTNVGVHRMMFDEKNNAIQHAFATTRPWEPSRPLRCATLPRRMEAMRTTDFWRAYGEDAQWLPTFGGYALLEMLFPLETVQNQFMADAHKGQPPHEPFGAIAQHAGLPVLDCNGDDVDYPLYMRALFTDNNDDLRIPMIVYASENVVQAIGPGLMTTHA